MMKILILLVILHFSFTEAFNAFSVKIEAHRRLCLIETLNVKDRFDISYQVGEGGNLDVDFVITNPTGTVIHSSTKESTGSFGFDADIQGKFTYCFSNEMSSVTDKLIYFAIFGPSEKMNFEQKTVKWDGKHFSYL